MANKEHLQRLKNDVSAWNAWRHEHLEINIDLSGAGFRRADLRGADLRRVRFWVVDFTGADLSGADLREVDFADTCLMEADLSGADLRGAHLRSGADLRGAHLRGANLSGADLREAYFSKADRREVHVTDPSFKGTDFRGANLSGTDLRGADFRRADLRGADFRGADLSRVNLSKLNLRQMDFSMAILKGVDFRLANLVNANLNGATLTDACLWETQRAGWSIAGVICEAVYWDEIWQKRTLYSLGEFERLYADKTKIELRYEGGMNPIEVATLPALIQHIESTHPGCVLRLQSVQEAPGGATVTLVVDEGGRRNPDELRTLQVDIEIVSQRAIRTQRALLEERGRREQAELKLQLMYDEIFPRTVRLIVEKSQSISINVSGGTIYGNIVGDVSGANAQIHYTQSDLATLEALHTVRHILEAGVSHVLVGEWLPLLHKIG